MTTGEWMRLGSSTAVALCPLPPTPIGEGCDRTGMRRLLWIGGGTLCVVLGGIGVFLPLLPTTPFLLLAAYAYSRSSPRLHEWLLGNRWFGEYVRRYVEQRSMTLRHKVFVLLLLWIVLASSARFAVSAGWLRGILVAIGVAVTGHILWLSTEGSSSHGEGRVHLEANRREDE
jgi:uncharacterized protein